MEENLLSKPNKNREHPKTTWYYDRKDENMLLAW